MVDVGKHLCKAIDNIERCPYLMGHVLNEGSLPLFCLTSQTVGLFQGLVLLFHFSIDLLNLTDMVSQ